MSLRGDNCAENGGQPHNAEPSVSEKIGWSPGQYLLEYRLQQSEKLLQMGMTVKQTALSCGFEDPFYYSRVFRKHYGMPPSDYRLEFAEIQ